MSAMDRSLSTGECIDSLPAGWTPGAALLARFGMLFLRWQDRAAQRRKLSRLTRAELDDIGIGEDAAAVEAAKPFWRA